MGLAAALAVLVPSARAARPGQLVPPQADILSVELQRRPAQTISFSGAGIRPPHVTTAPSAGSEYFLVEWFAHSPGIPPGAIVMLETITARHSSAKNHIHRTAAKSEGNQSLRFDIPPSETRTAGPVSEWRLRIIWRGHALATATSPGWDSARRPAP